MAKFAVKFIDFGAADCVDVDGALLFGAILGVITIFVLVIISYIDERRQRKGHCKGNSK